MYINQKFRLYIILEINLGKLSGMKIIYKNLGYIKVEELNIVSKNIISSENFQYI